MIELRMFRWFVGAAAVLLPLTNVHGQSSHDEARQRFESWGRPNGSAQARIVDEQSSVETARLQVGKERLEIVTGCNVPPGPNNAQIGVAVWFQLGASGRYVNPVKHRWNPKEELFIWLQTAVPLQISIHQNYPEDILPSKHIYPDPRFPATFSTIMPGAPVKLPVKFRTDDDLRKEIISLVFVRPDAANVPIVTGVSAIATATAVAGGGAASATAVVEVPASGVAGPGGVIRGNLDQAIQSQVEFMSEFNDAANQGKHPRLEIIGPDANVVTSATPNDVQFFAFGPGKQYQFQITLFK
jgi:hypothetical protein